MPPQRAAQGRPSWKIFEPQEEEIPDAPSLQPQVEVTNVKFHEAITMLSQVMTNEAGQ